MFRRCAFRSLRVWAGPALATAALALALGLAGGCPESSPPENREPLPVFNNSTDPTNGKALSINNIYTKTPRGYAWVA